MPVLKNGNARSIAKDAVVLDLGDLDRHAQQIIEGARREAAAIIEKARREAEELTSKAADIGREQGLKEGLERGLQEGRARGREELEAELKPRFDEILRSWSAALAQWEQDRADMLVAARQDVLSFALEMGRKVIVRTLEHDPTIVQDQLAEALALLSRRTAVVVAVHPHDRPLIDEALPALLQKFSNCTHATIRDDPDISCGGCVVRTENGEIDASIETQIERIVQAMLSGSHPQGSASE